MKYYIVLLIFLSTARLAQMPIKEQQMTKDEDNNNESTLHSINTPDIVLAGQNKTKTLCSIKSMGKLELNYDDLEAETFEISKISNFNDYTFNSNSNRYRKHRNANLSKMKHQFVINFALFNSFQIQNNNWVLILIDHPLFDSSIATYYNSNCDNENICYNLYHQPTQDSNNLAIIHKSATIEGFFCWSGIVTIGKNTKICYGVCLKNGVLISSGSTIKPFVSIGIHTMIGSNTFVSSCIDIGERNLIGDNVKIYRNIFTNPQYIGNKEQTKSNPEHSYKKNQFKLQMGDYNVVFSGTSWRVSSKPINFQVKSGKSSYKQK